MSIYELYFRSDYFKNIVDNFVIKHRTSYMGAFNCIEIKDAYEAHLAYLSKITRSNSVLLSRGLYEPK